MEEWRGIEGSRGYEVSNLGNVRSLRRSVVTRNGQTRVYEGVLFTGKSVNQYGHEKVPITRTDGTVRMVYKHRLVAEAFIPNPNGLPLVCHGPNGVGDNSAANLYWGTCQTNSDDTVRDETRKTRDRHPMVKLTEAQVEEIRSLLGKVRQRDIAKKYGVARSTISAISTKRSW